MTKIINKENLIDFNKNPDQPEDEILDDDEVKNKLRR